jgi:hypothetical protein
MRTRLIAAGLVLLTAAAAAAQPPDPADRIREADIKRDLFALADDAMRWREAGTIDEMTASAWVAERAREAGLQPAGDNGTYFQFFPLERMRVSAGSTVTLGGTALKMGRDVLPDAIVAATIDMAHALGMVVSAEGVETEEQRLCLVDLGCDRAQGYHLGAPEELATPRLVLVQQRPA